jgi:hypothetical protein
MFGRCPCCGSFQWGRGKETIKQRSVMGVAIHQCGSCKQAIGLPPWIPYVQVLLLIIYVNLMLFGVKAKIYPEDDRVGQFGILLVIGLIYIVIRFIGAYTIKSR